MIICFDIGGSAIKGAIARSPSDIHPLERKATPLHDFEAFVSVLRAVMNAAGGAPNRIALSVTGVVDPETRRTICANIPCIDGRLLASDLSERLGLPVLIANDADCFTLAEATIGAGAGHRVVLGAIFGTGVGGGLVIDGRLINSDGGFAGEWGHGPAVSLMAGNPPVAIPHFVCGCGQKGCVDSVGGARGLERLHQTLHGETLPSEMIIERWLTGDKASAQSVDCLVDLVSSPLALTINITGATVVPVGGGLANVEPLIFAIDRTVRQRILRKTDRPLVVRGALRIEPGLIGAAILGLTGSI
ncbi:ROK family protein [Pararhizobium sp.]|uniref:ROK family protein n=1 Tax=Pararhizobium sp. TaxID=1977563 RepID=UPI00271F9EA9|nr:ROK family protein [Pararhizobium sp.]MDO9418161.1 ROK family protein [Pararhizobium sp.]